MNYIAISTLAFIGSIIIGVTGLFLIIQMLTNLNEQDQDKIHPYLSKDQIKAHLKNTKK